MHRGMYDFSVSPPVYLPSYFGDGYLPENLPSPVVPNNATATGSQKG